MKWHRHPQRLTVVTAAATVLLAACGASAATPAGPAAATGTATGTATSASSTPATPAATDARTPAPSGSGTAQPPKPPNEAKQGVYAIGDSVMMGARSCLEKRGYAVNAKGSRQASAVAVVLRQRRSKLPVNVVVHTGTNGGATAADFRRIVKAVGPGHEIYLVTVQLPENGKYTFEARTNTAIEKVAQRYPNVHVADWNKRSNGQGRLTYGDGIHLPPAGCRAFARVVAAAIRAV